MARQLDSTWGDMENHYGTCCFLYVACESSLESTAPEYEMLPETQTLPSAKNVPKPYVFEHSQNLR